MFRKCLFTLAIGLSMLSATAQTYDSTGASRLWAPTPAKDSAPVIVTVPGYGEFTEGGVVSTFTYRQDGGGGCLSNNYMGICTAKKGAAGYYYQPTNLTVCPVGSIRVILTDNIHNSCTG